MRAHLAGYVVISLAALLPTAVAAGKGAPSITLDDPAGDTQDPKGNDVTRVVLDTDGAKVNVTVTLKDDLLVHAKTTAQGGTALEVFLDTDGNPKTGAKSFWLESATGFEEEMDVDACIAGRGMSICGGRTDPKSVEKAYASLSIKKLSAGGDNDKTTLSSLDSEATAMASEAGNTIKVSVPYAQLGLKSGQDVRIVMREADGGFDEKSFFKEVTLAVK